MANKRDLFGFASKVEPSDRKFIKDGSSSKKNSKKEERKPKSKASEFKAPNPLMDFFKIM